MQRIDYQTIGDVMRSIVAESSFGPQLDEVKAIECWPQIVGKELSGRMGRPRVSRGIMTIVTRHAPLRQEMMMHRTSLARAINQMLGKEVIKEIIFR
ncbi:MAG: DUF721 domain-containing protein [Bacteroidales bacterium]|nr:DUF721 domain-containing protein [Bacteroidales bacterium]MBD5190546.1 DUF721 domain-containing protein [Bacteroidales bacterium]MBD5209530.1 DUF721 domain-containing protein [Bacteroidales bacterium]MDE6083234.1 DUF721 domain-containing protein [Muribaculaceae bacterium]